MNTAGVIRRIQNLFGDSNQIIITNEMMVDWINEGQLEIVRETAYRTATDSTNNADDFIAGVTVSDLVLMKGVTYGSTPLSLIDLETIHRLYHPDLVTGIPEYYYTDGERIYLFPTPEASDQTQCIIRYVDAPTDLVSQSSNLDIPAKYHNDLVTFCVAKAHERNENWRAAEYYKAEFIKGIAQRKFEAEYRDDSFHAKGPDPSDIESDTYGWYA